MDEESGQLEIPEHEITTRRKQFRMKKDKREARRQKKEEKDKAKLAKQTDKEQKKADKQKQKEEKAKAKEFAKEEKKKGKAKAKAKAKSNPRKRTRETQDENNEEMNEEMNEDIHEETALAADAHAKEIPGVLAFVPSTDPASLGKHPAPGIRSRGLSKLRKLKSANFQGIVAVVGEATDAGVAAKQSGTCSDAIPTQNEDPCSTTKGSMSQKKRGKAESGKSKKQLNQSDRSEGKKAVPKSSKASKGKDSTTKKGDDQTTKKKASRSKKDKEPVPVDETVKKLVRHTLDECKATNCCHPSFKWPELGKSVELSTYWSRHAVGVKVDQAPTKASAKQRGNTNQKKQKAKGGCKRQVAYFAMPTTCTYSNLVLAGLFAPCMSLTGPYAVLHGKDQ